MANNILLNRFFFHIILSLPHSFVLKHSSDWFSALFESLEWFKTNEWGKLSMIWKKKFIEKDVILHKAEGRGWWNPPRYLPFLTKKYNEMNIYFAYLCIVFRSVSEFCALGKTFRLSHRLLETRLGSALVIGLLTVPHFFHKIFEIERFALWRPSWFRMFLV